MADVTKLLDLPEDSDHFPLVVTQDFDSDGYVIVRQNNYDAMIIVAPKRIRALRDALSRALANLPPGSKA